MSFGKEIKWKSLDYYVNIIHKRVRKDKIRKRMDKIRKIFENECKNF